MIGLFHVEVTKCDRRAKPTYTERKITQSSFLHLHLWLVKEKKCNWESRINYCIFHLINCLFFVFRQWFKRMASLCACPLGHWTKLFRMRFLSSKSYLNLVSFKIQVSCILRVDRWLFFKQKLNSIIIFIRR